MFSPADGPTWGCAQERGDFPPKPISWPHPPCLLLHAQPCSAWRGKFRLITFTVNVSCSLPRSFSSRSSLMAF